MDESRKNCTHVIFDMDGLMIDTEVIYTRVSEDLVKPYGKTFDWSVKSKMMGKHPLAANQVMVDELQLPVTAEFLLKESRERLFKLFPTAPLLPGVEKLVRHLHKHNIPMAVATGSAEPEYNNKTMNKKELFELMSHVVKSDDPNLQRSKPAPDIFQLAASRFPTPPTSPGHVLVFEDAPNGVAAARTAGMNVVMVPDKKMDRSGCSQAHAVLESLEEFDPTVWGLPGF